MDERLDKGSLGYPDRATRKTSRFKRVALLLTCIIVLYNLLGVYRTGGEAETAATHRKGHLLVGKSAEKLFLTVPEAESCLNASRVYATKPHMAGTEGDLATAKEFLDLLQREFNIPRAETIFPAGSTESRNAILNIARTHAPQAWIDIYYPVMNLPLDRALQALDDDGKVVWEADLEERADDTDPEAGKYSEAVPTFHGLSKDGDVTGKLIYVNYGLKEDYDDLVQKGVNFTGSIVLARYGGNFRGLKVKGAQELGAAGVLIYSDPRDDGTVTVENGYEVYPNGPARNPTSVQRGSVQYLSMYPGDPTTPGYPAYENATRTDGENIPLIPSLPLSWANAKHLLKDLDGGWEGRKVRLVNHVDTKVTPIWNTMAVIPGYIKDEVVVIGNHRDAWVMGAADPTSGTASIHETIRGLGALSRKGWKPLRTIIIASWDAEEYGLIGSTEWGEDFAEWIDANVVAYLNLDGSASGSRFSSSASPLLSHLVQQAAIDLPHPTDAHRTLWDATKDDGKFLGESADGVSHIDADVVALHESQKLADGLGIGVLGSGSDFTVFLQRLGVASMNHGFGSTLHDAVYHYHSVYDSERWMEIYGDEGFHRHVAVAKHLGLITLRLSDSIVLPLNTTHYAFELENYLDKVNGLMTSNSVDVNLAPLRDSIHSLQAASRALDYEKLVAERKLRHIIKKWKKKHSKLDKLKRKVRKAYCRVQKRLGHPCKPRHSHGSPADSTMEAPMYPVHELGKLKPRIGRYPAWLREQENQEEHEVLAGIALNAGMDRLPTHACSSTGAPLPRLPLVKLKEAIKRVRAVNKKLIAFERGFISKDGIPEREWYKHLGVAPGKWLGYGATTLPALTESITIEKNATMAKYEAHRLKELVDSLADQIRSDPSLSE